MTLPSAAAYLPALAMTSVPLAIWSTIASLEILAVHRAFRPGEPLGPDLAMLAPGRVPALLGTWLSAAPVLPATAALRLAAGIALPVVVVAGAVVAAGLLLVLIAGCSVWLSIATGGGDGADKIALVACGAGALGAAGIAIDAPLLCLAGLVWATGQAAIAYLSAGVTKLARDFWRDGAALAAAMTSYRSGHPFAAAAVRRPAVAAVLAWTIMLAEALFPLALVAPPPVCLAWLAGLALFHFATAVVMGLNTYPWAFFTTYPCVAMANAIMVGRTA